MVKRVLVACEYSGAVRDAFRRLGFDAWSCDLVPTEQVGHHLTCDVRHVLNQGWDLMIAHPPCTYLSRAAAPRWAEREIQAQAAAAFVRALYKSPIASVAIENPIGRLNQLWRYPDQIIQPWAHGDPYTKATCLWLRNLPPLLASYQVVPLPSIRDSRGRLRGVFMHQSTDFNKDKRRRARSRTFPGIAAAMAQQWGAFLLGVDWVDNPLLVG